MNSCYCFVLTHFAKKKKPWLSFCSTQSDLVSESWLKTNHTFFNFFPFIFTQIPLLQYSFDIVFVNRTVILHHTSSCAVNRFQRTN